MSAYNPLIESRFELLEIEKNRKSTAIEIEESTLFFVLSGTVNISYDEKIGQEVKAGSFFLIRANSYLLAQLREQVKLILCPFLLENHFAENFVVELFDSSLKETMEILPVRDRMKDFICLLSACLSDGITSGELYTVFKQELFLFLKLYYSKVELSLFFAPVIGKDAVFKDFVLKNCLKAATVEELASLANYSTSGFEKKFRRSFNESPYKWMLRYKAKRILQDIQISHKPFKGIAEEYGFSSQSYFYTFCRKHYGDSPREMRKQSKSLLKKRKR
jgi:AraC-like DNA-binding protein